MKAGVTGYDFVASISSGMTSCREEGKGQIEEHPNFPSSMPELNLTIDIIVHGTAAYVF